MLAARFGDTPLELGREHVGAEGSQAFGRGEAQMSLAVGAAGRQTEQVLVAAQGRVVVVRAGGIGRAGHDVPGVEQQGSDLAAAGGGAVRRVAGVARCVRVRPGLLVAAGGVRTGATEMSASSNVMTTSMSPCLYAGEWRMRGIQARRKPSAAVRPPAWPPALFGPAQVPSWPSLHRLGVMNPKRGVVLLAAEVLRQVAGGRRGAVGTQGPEWDHVGVALGRVVDHRVEPHERVVPSRVLVGRRRHLGRVGGADRRVSAVRSAAGIGCSAVTGGRVAHVLLVGAPGRDVGRRVRRVLRVELGGDGRHARRVDATLAVDLPGVGGLVGIGRAGRDVRRSRSRRPHSRPGCPRWAPGRRPGRCSCPGCRGRSRSSSGAARPWGVACRSGRWRGRRVRTWTHTPRSPARSPGCG